jgi:hypothetical protein
MITVWFWKNSLEAVEGKLDVQVLRTKMFPESRRPAEPRHEVKLFSAIHEVYPSVKRFLHIKSLTLDISLSCRRFNINT